MIYAAEARRQIMDLRDYYERQDRPEAIAGLATALRVAERLIADHSEAGVAAPWPYPQLVRPGLLWTKAGRYWIASDRSRHL